MRHDPVLSIPATIGQHILRPEFTQRKTVGHSLLQFFKIWAGKTAARFSLLTPYHLFWLKAIQAVRCLHTDDDLLLGRTYGVGDSLMFYWGRLK